MLEQKYKDTFEKLFIWKESNNLFFEIYQNYLSINSKDYFFKDQILRATLSISNNIAEGYERGTDKEFIRFLYIARGSCGETRNMLNLAEKLKMFDNDSIQKRKDSLAKISSGIKRLIDTKKSL